MVAFSLGTGRLRTGHLYPISRRQRATVEFAASAASFGISFLGIVGGSVLAGWLVGRWSGLPLFPQPALEFIIRMAMVVPFMPLIRRGALQLEFSQSWVQLFLIIGIVAIFVIASQSLVLAWGLRVGALICLTSIIVSQFAYYAALRQFYTKRDLFQRGPTQDMIGLT